MATPWVILERRFGESVRNPTIANFAAAIAELYHERVPGLTEGDYEEHGAASLRYGYDEGPMFVIQVTRGGTATLEQWADQDYEVELMPPLVRHSVPKPEALDLFKRLARGDIAVLEVLMEKGPGRLMA